jgi:histidinol-phosphatase (PHP family)
MAEMALAAYERGVRHLCFTDHCDLDDPDTGLEDPRSYDFRQGMLRAFEQAKGAVAPDMRLYLGLELGGGHHYPERMEKIAQDPALDFILGTLHNIRGERDFYLFKHTDEAVCRAMTDRYMDELIELSYMNGFDVMAHVGYLIRYFRRDGIENAALNMSTHGDKLDALLRNLIDKGKGIEVNCSGLRSRYIKDTIPGADVIRHYKSLGGEIITVGSDAHETADAGAHVADGFALLRELGYKYVTIFSKRRPEFIAI